jgi:hypothetical protein
MIDPITLMQLAPLVIGGVQSIAGLTKKTPEYPTRQYGAPDSAKKALSNAEYIASQTQLPGYDTIKSNIGENVAGGISQMERVADSPAALLSGITRLTSDANESLQGLGVAGANNWQQNQGVLRNELGAGAQTSAYRFRYAKYVWCWDGICQNEFLGKDA